MRKSLSLASFGLLIVLAMMWGSSFTFIKIALEGLTPLSIAAGRICLAAVLLCLVAFVQRNPLPQKKSDWGKLLGMAILGNAAPFFLISWGETHVDGGMTSVLMAVVPLSVPIMAHFLTDDEKLTPYMILGVIIGFIGLIVLVGPSVFAGLGKDLISQGAIVLAALCYGGASLFARRLSHVPLMTVAACSMVMAALLIAPVALIFDQPWTLTPSLKELGAVVYLGLFPTALANILLLVVINSSGVSFLALNNYLVPLFGVGIAALTLGEQVPAEMLSALGIIFVGIFVSNMKRKSG